MAELLNFTRASEQLRVAQPALSRQIRDLEAELSVSLLERGPRATRLTEAGAVFLAECRAILQRTDEAVTLARAVARGERGEIHVGYAPSLTTEVLPCALDSFHNAAPGVHVKLYDLSSEEILRWILKGKLHLGLMARPSERALHGLNSELLREYAICIALPRNHRLSKHKTLNIRDIADESLVVYSRNEYPEYFTMLMALFATVNRSPRITEEHESASSLIAAAEIGRGLIIVPRCLEMLSGGRLRFITVNPLQPPIQLVAVYDPKQIGDLATKFVTAALAIGRTETSAQTK